MESYTHNKSALNKTQCVGTGCTKIYPQLWPVTDVCYTLAL